MSNTTIKAECSDFLTQVSLTEADLVCKETGSQELVGYCNAKSFWPVQQCQESKEAICNGTFNKSPCDTSETTASLNNKYQEYLGKRIDFTEQRDLTCPEDTTNLVCNKSSDGSEAVGVCLGETFARNPACNERAQEICEPKGGFKENVCGTPYTDETAEELKLRLAGKPGEIKDYRGDSNFSSLFNTNNHNSSIYNDYFSWNNPSRTPGQGPEPTTQPAATEPTGTTQAEATDPSGTTQAEANDPSGTTQEAVTEPNMETQKMNCSMLEKLACKDTGTQKLAGLCQANTFFPLEECDPNSSCMGMFHSNPCANTAEKPSTGIITEMAIKNNKSKEMEDMAYNSEMTEYKTSSGLAAANQIVIDELHKNVDSINEDKKTEQEVEAGKTPISYYIHEVSENGEIRLYEYEYDDYDALMEMKEKEERVKRNMKAVEGKKLLTDNRGVKYYYNPKTDTLTSYEDDKSVETRLENLKKRVNSIEGKNSGKDENLSMPKDKNSIVYLNNNFGNGEHPDATTEVSQEKTGNVDEVKVSGEEAEKIIKDNKVSQEAAMEEMEEEEIAEEMVKKLTPVKRASLSTFDKVAIALFVIVLVGLLVWLLNDRFHFLPNPFKSKSTSINNSKKFNVVSNYNRVLSKVRRNLN